MRRLLPVLALVVALAGEVEPRATAQEATQEATPAAGCPAGPATPTAAVVTVNEEIAGELERLFRCLTARNWEAVARIVAIPDGSTDPFTVLEALDGTGLFSFTTRLESQMVRSTGPEGAMVDVAWRVSGQLRSERWTFRRRDGGAEVGRWALTAVEAGVPRYDGMLVGISGGVSSGAVTLSRSELINPGGVELRLDVAADVEPPNLLVMFPVDACTGAGPSPLVAFAQVIRPAVAIALDDPPDGDYALALVSTLAPISRDTICTAPSASLKVRS